MQEYEGGKDYEIFVVYRKSAVVRLKKSQDDVMETGLPKHSSGSQHKNGIEVPKKRRRT